MNFVERVKVGARGETAVAQVSQFTKYQAQGTGL